MNENSITKSGLEKLKKELAELQNIKLKEITKQIKQAASFGDLSENAAYHQAKEDQSFARGRVLELEKLIATAKVVEHKKTQEVEIGSKVTVSSGKEKETLEIVSPEEADPMEGKISFQSPLGEALYGKLVNSTVEVETPSGKTTYKIIRVD